MKKRFKYKPESINLTKETVSMKIAGFPGFLSLGLAWIFSSVAGLHYLVLVLSVSGSQSVEVKTPPTPTLIYSGGSIGVLILISVLVWWFLARAVRRIVIAMHNFLGSSINFTFFCILINLLGWLIFIPLVTIVWEFNLYFAIFLAVAGVLVGGCSFFAVRLLLPND